HAARRRVPGQHARLLGQLQRDRRAAIVVARRHAVRRQRRAVAEQLGLARLPAGAVPQGQHPQHQPEERVMLNEAQARQLLERASALIRATKGAEGQASLTSAQVGNTRFAVNEITSSGDVERTQLSITVQLGLRAATATTNQLDDRGLEDAVARASRMAQLVPENPEEMPPLGAQT